MKTMLSAAIALAAIGLATVPSLAKDQAEPGSAPGTKSGECLQIMNVWDFKPVPGNRALIVTDRARRKYKMTFYVPCTGLQYHMGLAFRSRGTGGLSCLTRGDSVITHDIVGPPVCLISSVVPYTPQMEKTDAEARAKAEKAGQTGK